MTLSVGEDLAHCLSSPEARVLVTAGSSSCYAQVSPADAEMLEDSSGLKVIGHGVWILFPLGGLGTIGRGTSVVVGNGPLAGTYTVDKVLRAGEGSLSLVLAL